MKSVLVFLFLTLIAVSSAQNFPFTCSTAVAFCGSSQFSPGTAGDAELGPNYDCLSSQPAPAWFFFQISTGNNLTILFTNPDGVDIDYAIWGPFSSVNCAAVNSGTVPPVSCSFAPDATETAVLSTVNVGEIYIMVVTNFGRGNTVVSVNVLQDTTNGNLDCGIVSATPTNSPLIAPSATPSSSDNLGDVCSNGEAFCGLSLFRPGTVGAAQFGPNYGCLTSQPAPEWFFFQIASGNNLTIQLTNTNNIDIDYAIWGPFSTPDCTTVESGVPTPVACSFADFASETAFLPSVAAGQFYVMVVTNFGQQDTVVQVVVDQTTTNGDLNCGIVSPSNTPSVPLSATPSTSSNLGDVCLNADPFCGLTSFNPGVLGTGQSGPDYGCLGQQPAPAWFFFRIATGNNITIVFTNTNNIDIDYAIWGPFATSFSADCPAIDSGLIAPVSCSFAPDAQEVAVLRNVNPGEFYVMVITNFGRQQTVITAVVDFRSTNGDLDCTIVPPSSTPSLSPSTSFTSSISITPSNSPSTSFSPSTSLSNSESSSRTPSTSLSSSRSASPSPSESATTSPSRSSSRSQSASPSISASSSLSRSVSSTRTPSRTSSPTSSPSRSSSPTRSESRTPSATRSETRTPSATRSETRTPTTTPIPRTTGIRETPTPSRTPRTTGARTTGVVNRTTGARTTGVQVINRSTGARTTGMNPSSTPSQSEIISSSAAFSASPFFSVVFVVLAFSLTILSIA